VSLCNPVKVFVNENKDIAFNLQQEFIRIRPHMEADREAIVAGLFITAYRVIFLKTLSSFHYILAINCVILGNQQGVLILQKWSNCKFCSYQMLL